ncbi:hypothetical protein [Serratia aquatilis]|uniref:Uncharacterized protein n=1 Tax=Serratia aquatilis TaxID=1737515 RepID=A0ABV6EG23_9GAMM
METKYYPLELFERLEDELRETEASLRSELKMRFRQLQFFNGCYPKVEFFDYLEKSPKLKRQEFKPTNGSENANLDGLIATLYEIHIRIQYIARKYLLNNWQMPKHLRVYLVDMMEGLSSPGLFQLYESKKRNPEKEAIEKYIVFRVMLCEYLGIPQESKEGNVFEDICDEVKWTHNYSKLKNASLAKKKYLDNKTLGMPLHEFILEYLNEWELYRNYLINNKKDGRRLRDLSTLIASLHTDPDILSKVKARK